MPETARRPETRKRRTSDRSAIAAQGRAVDTSPSLVPRRSASFSQPFCRSSSCRRSAGSLAGVTTCRVPRARLNRRHGSRQVSRSFCGVGVLLKCVRSSCPRRENNSRRRLTAPQHLPATLRDDAHVCDGRRMVTKQEPSLVHRPRVKLYVPIRWWLSERRFALVTLMYRPQSR